MGALPHERKLVISPRWYKVLRDLGTSKARTLLVVLSITVGVFAVGMVVDSQTILSREMTKSYAATNPASVRLGIASFNDDIVQAAGSVKGVRETQGQRIVSTRIQIGSGEWLPLGLFAYANYNDIRVDKVVPERGAWPPPEHELLVERKALDFIKSKVGDTVLVEMPSGKQRKLRIAGTVHSSIRLPTPLTGWVWGFVTFDTLEWLGEPRGYDELSLTVSENTLNREHIRYVANQVRDKVEKVGWPVDYITLPTPGKHPADDIVQAVILVLAALGFLSLLLSGFLVSNTISALLAQQVRQIGIMKAIGARPRQILAMYLVMTLIFGLAALAVGIPLGVLGARALTSFIAGFLNFDITSFAITPQVFVLQVVAGLLVPLLAALYPIISGIRITVREALSYYGLDQSQLRENIVGQPTKAVDWSTVQIGSRPVLISLRNTFRRKGRLILTLITLTLGSAIFIAVFSVRASVGSTLDEASQYWQYDIQVNLGRSYPIQQIEREALGVSGVVSAEGWGQGNARRLHADGSEGDNILLIAPPPMTDLLHPVILQGRWLLPNDENTIVVNADFLRDETDTKIGDETVLKIRGRETTWKVIGIIKGQLQGPIAYVNYTDFERVVRDLQNVSSMRIVTEQHDQAFQSQVAKVLEQYLKRKGLRVRLVMTAFELRSMSARQFDIVLVFLLIMAALMGIVGGIGLTGTMMLNVFERTREIGVMRAIGASNGAVFQIVVVEGLLIGVMSWLVGIILALPLSKLLSDAVGMAFMHTSLSYTFSPSGIVLWLVVVVILSGSASFLPARRALQVSVREALMYE
jgi:putative ABC transport system permease protein